MQLSRFLVALFVATVSAKGRNLRHVGPVGDRLLAHDTARQSQIQNKPPPAPKLAASSGNQFLTDKTTGKLLACAHHLRCWAWN